MATKVSAHATAKIGASKSDGALIKQQPQVEQKSEVSPAENPVGGLQEQCQKRLWPMPVYTFECSNGDDPALRQFTCTVALPAAGHGRGVGRSKRLAKRQAAAALLRQVVAADGGPSTTPEQPPTPTATQKTQRQAARQKTQRQTARQKTQTPSPAGRKTQTQSPSPASIATPPAACPLDEASFQRLCASKRLQSAAKAGAEIGGIFRGVRNRKAGAALPPISPPCSGSNSASEQLTELGKVHRFGVVFLVDGASTGSCGHRSVVKLCTMPTIVAVGNGADAAASREEACRAAMDYLCLLTKENAANAAATKK